MFDLKGHIHTVCLLMQFHTANLVGPIDITDLTEASAVKDVNLSHIPFRFSPALGAIQKDGLDVAVVKPDLGFEAILLGLPDVTESAEGTSGYVKACLDVFMGTMVVTYEASDICEVFNALRTSSSPLIVIGNAVGALTNNTLVFFWLICRPVRFVKLLSRLDFS